jgi:Lipid A 3-O-deacylase (PagL)
MKPSAFLTLLLFFIAASIARGQTGDSGAFSRRNTFTVFAEYSNDSSHILMGVSENRKLAAFGGSYARRLWLSPSGDLRYIAEIRPVLMESDPVFLVAYVDTPINPSGPVSTFTFTGESYFACKPGRTQQTVQTPTQAYSVSAVTTCGRRWTYAQGFSPVGLQYSFWPRHGIQPFVSSTAGYIFSTRPIPTSDAGSFNFTFDFGGGIEFFRSRTHSIQVEYRFHHISNHYTSDVNPGIDNGVFKLSYAFGR